MTFDELYKNVFDNVVEMERETLRKENKMVHDIKIEPGYLEHILEGRKTFEIRYNDRDYQVGDHVRYEKKYLYVITYITNFQQKEGYVVFAIRKSEMEALNE